jgi:hypothetical protein
MASQSDRIVTLEGQVRKLMATVSTFQGQPSNATFSVPHNDSWLFEDNVDATHAANLRYIVSKNVTRVVSARLSIFLAPYRTYNNFSATTTLAGTAHFHPHAGTHLHGHAAVHGHTWGISPSGLGTVSMYSVGGVVWDTIQTVAQNIATTNVAPGNSDSSSPGNTDNESAHTHPISITSTLGVTEGATATGVTLAFDGVDQTAALGGPFNADVIELDVRRFIGITQSVKHTIAMQPTGLGRIEAHLRLGVYVSAGQIP